MHRHLIQRSPFELRVATNDQGACQTHGYDFLPLPPLLQRVLNSRLHDWAVDCENLLAPYLTTKTLDGIVESFRPDVILTVADNSLCWLAAAAAKRHQLPLAGFFQDWFPIMDGHYGHRFTWPVLHRRFRRFYQRCDVTLCISDGMRQALGPHRNAKVIYPIAGGTSVSSDESELPPRRLRLVYVGSVERFYGRMLSSLLEASRGGDGFDIVVAGPRADWPAETLSWATQNGIYLGFQPPEEAAHLLSGADALLVVMSFEEEYRLFMETSFNTKIADYCSFGKPIVFWGPAYAAPRALLERTGSAVFVDSPNPAAVLLACNDLARDRTKQIHLARSVSKLRDAELNPERLQSAFVESVTSLVAARDSRGDKNLNTAN